LEIVEYLNTCETSVSPKVMILASVLGELWRY